MECYQSDVVQVRDEGEFWCLEDLTLRCETIVQRTTTDMGANITLELCEFRDKRLPVRTWYPKCQVPLDVVNRAAVNLEKDVRRRAFA